MERIVGGAATYGPILDILGKSADKQLKRHFGYAPARIPVCLYVLAVYVHKDNPCREGLLIEEVGTTFSSAFKNKVWGDLGCGGEWSKRPINLYVPVGRRCYWARYFLWDRLGRVFAFKDSVKKRWDDAAVVSAVAKDARGLGVAVIGSRTDEVRALPIAPEGTTEFVPATAEKACSGEYPLSRSFCLVLNHDPRAGFELDPPRREFLRYVLSREGQQAVIKAGHVPLSAELAERALAQVGLTPSGEGSWDWMLSRLCARRLPSKLKEAIAGLTRWVGDRPTYEQLVGLAKSLTNTGLTSSVTFATDQEGATVKYRLIGNPKATPTDRPTKHAEATVPIGLYHVWTERDGKATSPRDAWFQIIQEHERIKICESR
ncbi:MAG: PstS family phosphate ABC transporter substrate-binding protein [Planctomycetota bacterium]